MRTPLVIIRVLNYEYWPWWLFYMPMIPYWLIQAFKTKSFTFFTAVNPGIEAGGFYGEKKKDILQHIPEKFLASTFYVLPTESIGDIQENLKLKNIKFPIIAKPNVGERGNGIEKIFGIQNLIKYHNSTKVEYLIQEFVDYEIELGVLYSRLPHEKVGKVSSITMKEFLTLTGDGKKTVEELVMDSSRARFQLKGLKSKFKSDWKTILPEGQKMELEPIGNHCKGTKFLNVNHLINDKLNSVFDEISKQFEGFYYGRYDMKVASISDLYEGKNIKILELNGVSSDPGHIYDPQFRLINAYKDLKWHWKRVADISIENQTRGIKPLHFTEIIQILKTHFA